MTRTIILIGPMAAGKTTVAALLAARLNIPLVSLDEICRSYYEESGYDRAHVEQLLALDDDEAAYKRYVKPYEAYAVERIVADHPDCVLDLGAGHVIHDDDDLFQRVRAALAPHANVVSLVPSADVDKSVVILGDRIAERIREYAKDGEDYSWALKENEYFVRHRSIGQLAKMTVYTENKSPDETCHEIIQLVSGGMA